MDTSKCPCGSNQHYNECCKSFHLGDSIPETAAKLMRSRYSAYVKKLQTYLLETWHPKTRPAKLDLDENPEFRWLSLEVVATQDGEKDDSEGFVSFKASFSYNGEVGEMEERSKFVKENGRWFYLAGS